MPATMLPGLYYDESRKRYFPLYSQSTHLAVQTTPSGSHQIPGTLHLPRQHYIPWRTAQIRTMSPSYATIMRESHHNLCYHYAHTSLRRQEKVPSFGEIRVLQIARVEERAWRLIGDSQGWIFSDKDLQCIAMNGDDMHYWSADFNLQVPCAITSMSVSESQVLSTCFGPGKFSVQDLNSPDRVFILNLKGVVDIRASHLQGNEAVLGAKNKIVYISDISQSTSPRHIGTKSDVFAIRQKHYLLYAGERNGSVERFDLRMSTHQGQKLFDSRFGLKTRSSVLFLDILDEYELLLSHLNGNLASFDLRFSPTSLESRPPLKTFVGHVNENLHHLGIAVDPKQNFLFAAAKDNRIRGWSLRSGDPIVPNGISNRGTNPFEMVFPAQVSALQVTNDPGPDGVSLWAACDRDIYRFHLGQQSS